MKLFKFIKKVLYYFVNPVDLQSGEREYLDRLYKKARTPYEDTSKWNKRACPRYESHNIGPAGYGDRLECKKCGMIFT